MSEQKLRCPLCHAVEKEAVEGNKPCKRCQEHMEKGFLLIGVDFSMGTIGGEIPRTGHRWVVLPTLVQDMYSPEAMAKGAALIDVEEAKQIGLPVSKIV